MRLDATTKIWLCSAAAAGLMVSVSAYYRAVGSLREWLVAAAFTVIVAFLFALALKLAAARPRLNLTVAAETIVALGIFSLIISITVGIYRALTISSPEMFAKDLSPEDVLRLASPFLEGLTTAAIAPLVATFMRNCEASLSSLDTGEAGIKDSELATGEIAKRLADTMTTFARLNEQLERNSDGLQRAVVSAATAATRFSGVFQSESDRLRLAFQRIQAEVNALSGASDRSRLAISKLTMEMSGLSRSAKDARDLLDALGYLIESVERFVKPESIHA